MKSIIYKSTGAWYTAKTEAGEMLQCRIKGKLKIDKDITSTNPIAVGDEVNLEREENGDAMITQVLARKNYLIRTSPHSKYQKHIVAANLDHSLIIATLREPRTSTGFIDRYLVSCEAYHIPTSIIFNKSDLWNADDRQEFEWISSIYQQAGYAVYVISAEQEEGFETLRNLLRNKTTLLTGHSGVGKSTIMNKLLPGREIATQDVSAWSGKGMHTTTFAEMYDLDFGGRIIDTPGIRELGIVNINRTELSGYYPEMNQLLNDCKYNNCTHQNEPQCAIKEGVRNGVISEERYVNYIKIFESITDRNY